MAAVDIAAAWRRGQEGWPRRFVLVQLPNVPLIVSFAASFAAGRASGSASDYAEAVSRIGLGVFAYLEIAEGVNWFRRVLGTVVMVQLVMTLGRALH